MDVAHDLDAYSSQARLLVAHVRALPAPAGAQVAVGGVTASLVDLLHALAAPAVDVAEPALTRCFGPSGSAQGVTCCCFESLNGSRK